MTGLVAHLSETARHANIAVLGAGVAVFFHQLTHFYMGGPHVNHNVPIWTAAGSAALPCLALSRRFHVWR